MTTNGPILSILVLSVPGRDEQLASLLASLEQQAERANRENPERAVEVLVLRDNCKRTIGAKRNALLDTARGKYVAFVDDDDMVSPHYVRTILDNLTGRTDLLCFRVWVTGFSSVGRNDGVCIYDPDLEVNANLQVEGRAEYRRQPNHLMVWRRAIMRDFEDRSVGEDDAWAARMHMRAAITAKTDEVLYTYCGRV